MSRHIIKPLTQAELKDRSEVWTAEYRASVGEVAPIRVVKIDGPRLTPEEIWTDGVSTIPASKLRAFDAAIDAVSDFRNRRGYKL